MKRAQQTRRREDPMPGSAIEDPANRPRSFLLYGRAGTGKTTLASSFPKPLLHLDLRDEGTDSIADVKGVTLRKISSVEEYEDMYWWLKEHPGLFKTVVSDTITQLQDIGLNELFGDRKLKAGKKLGDWGTMSRKDWGALSATMKALLLNMRDLTEQGTNVVFVAQDKVFSGNETEDREGIGEFDPEMGPALMTSVAKVLNASVSVIGNTLIRTKKIKKEVNGKKRTQKKTEFCLRIGPNPVYVTKVRKPKSYEAPSLIVDPTYDDILDIILGE